jgi:branched-subunit amino acid aminotransferase/4-amino-4-deoxychorismate lyase
MSCSPVAYFNDRFLPQAEARLPLHDAGFVLGVTVTDLCRTIGRRPFRLADHLARFRASCELAGVSQPRTDVELTAIADTLVVSNSALLSPEGDLAIVFFATPGPVGYYLGEPGGAGDGPPTFGMHTFPLPFARYARLFAEGARLVIPETRHVPASAVDPHIKQRSRIHYWLAERETHRIDPGASAMLLDHNGNVTETAAANLLLVRGGTVLTPLRATVLEGVSLRVTEELCQQSGIPFEERPLTPADCRAADEAMVTSTPYCLAGVRSIDGAQIRWPGHVYERLQAGWNDLAGIDLRRQILRNQ